MGGDLHVTKIDGKVNPADLMTKHLAQHDAQRHLTTLNMELSDDRAVTAPKLAHTASRTQDDHWTRKTLTITRHHRVPRSELCTPLQLRGSPDPKKITPSRVTNGRFIDTGEAFQRVDTWTAKLSAHLDLGRRWVGKTVFLLRTDVDLRNLGETPCGA